MSFVIRATPEAARAAQNLRGHVRRAYLRKVDELAEQGSAACGYRLEGVEGFWACAVHLYRDWRLIAVFLNRKQIVIVLVGRHVRGPKADVYARLFDLLELDPSDEPRTKPPCRGKPSDWELDRPGDIDDFIESLEEMLDRRADEPETRAKIEKFLGGATVLKDRQRRAHNR